MHSVPELEDLQSLLLVEDIRTLTYSIIPGLREYDDHYSYVGQRVR